MCGIYGITTRNHKFIEDYITQCSYRGPDGSDIWSDDNVTLGHNLLAITSQPTQGKQPWQTSKGVLVYNGEIFNYNELKDQYKDSFQPKTTCDTEFLSWYLSNHDPLTCPQILDSMHGFAWYDKQSRLLYLSRDHAGIKPVYYAEIGVGLVFGSEIKGLLDIVPNARKLDQMSASMMSTTGLNVGRNTMFSNIKRLLPGETLVYDVTQKKILQRKLDNVVPESNRSLDLEEFRYEANQTVKMCTLGIRKFGMFLSGGLDSTLVAYELKNILGELDSFTNTVEPNVVLSNEDHNDDAIHAEKFAKEFGLNHHKVVCTPDDVLRNWESSVACFEEPRYAMSIPMYYQTNRFLADKGVVVTMAGDMGDELLGGYQKYWKLRKEGITSYDDMLWKWMHRIKRPLQLSNFVIDKNEILEELKNNIPEEIWNPEDPINSYMALDCLTQVPEEFFTRNDKFGMQFSMEGRFPLATKRFMKYCLGIHSKHKIGETKADTKLPTKLAYKGILPDYILNKSKTGWTVPLSYWLTHSNENTYAKLYKYAHDSMKEKNPLDDIVTMSNWNHGKTKVVSWMVRTWAKHYNLVIE